MAVKQDPNTITGCKTSKLQAHARCDHMLFGHQKKVVWRSVEEERGEEREGNDDSQ